VVLKFVYSSYSKEYRRGITDIIPAMVTVIDRREMINCYGWCMH